MSRPGQKSPIVWTFGALTLLLVVTAVVYGLGNDVDVGMALLVIGLGMGAWTVALNGKPAWSGGGLSETVLARLPQRAWRAVVTVVGAICVAVGLLVLLAS